MNIVKGCIIECELLVEGACRYVPLKVEVLNDKYLLSDNGSPYHEFNILILEQQHPTDKYNKYFPVGGTLSARAGDLYNGEIVEYPADFAQLCAEKEQRKQTFYSQLNPRPPR